jgi:orotate phosphoribosyltransferase
LSKKEFPDLLREACERIKLEIALMIYFTNSIYFSDRGYRLSFHDEHPEIPPSPHYLQLRNLFRNPQACKRIAGIMRLSVENLSPDYLADLPHSVSPLVAYIFNLTEIPIVTVPSEKLKNPEKEKDYGVSKVVIAGCHMGTDRFLKRCLITDDTVSMLARTKLIAIPILQKAGYEILKQILVLVDRNEGGKETLEKHGYELISIIDLHEMLQIYRDKGYISAKQYDKSVAFSLEAKKHI